MSSNNLEKGIEELIELLGEQYVATDPEILLAYSRTLWVHGSMHIKSPACVTLPKDTEQARSIILIANKYKLPFIPVGSFQSIPCQPNRPNTIIICPRRMKFLEIDEENRFAIVEPGVSYSELQAEAIKRGLYVHVISGGGNTSALASHLFHGWTPTMYRTGLGAKNILGAEWILPDGRIIKVGSLCTGSFFHGAGPGPDLRGIMRGFLGHAGGMGMVTKLAIKLHPWYGPDHFPVVGISPNIGVEFPKDRIRGYLILFPNVERVINTIYKVCHQEIGFTIIRLPGWFGCGFTNSDKKTFWKQWKKYYQHVPEIVIFISMGYSSEYLEYEYKVLKKIVKEEKGIILNESKIKNLIILPKMLRISTNIKLLPLLFKLSIKEMLKMSLPEILRSCVSVRVINPTGSLEVIRLAMDSVRNCFKMAEDGLKILKKFVPPLPDSKCYWIAPTELGYFGNCEIDIFFNNLDEGQRNLVVNKVFPEFVIHSFNEQIPDGYPFPIPQSVLEGYRTKFSRLFEILSRLKSYIDPNNVSNPPYPIR